MLFFALICALLATVTHSEEVFSSNKVSQHLNFTDETTKSTTMASAEKTLKDSIVTGSFQQIKYFTDVSTSCDSSTVKEVVGFVLNQCVAISLTKSLKFTKCTVPDSSGSFTYSFIEYSDETCTTIAIEDVTNTAYSCGSDGKIGSSCSTAVSANDVPYTNKYLNIFDTWNCEGNIVSYRALNSAENDRTCTGNGCARNRGYNDYPYGSTDVQCGAFESFAVNLTLSVLLGVCSALFM